MKRTIRNSEIVPPFVLSHDDFRQLVSMIYSAVDEQTLSIKLELGKDETVEFSELEDIMGYTDFPPKITVFEIRALGITSKYVMAGNTHGPDGGFRVHASSEQASWNVGTVHEIARYLKGRRIWYFWLYNKWIEWPLMLAGYLLSVSILFLLFSWSISNVASAILLMGVVSFFASFAWPIVWYKILRKRAQWVFPKYAILQEQPRSTSETLTIFCLVLGTLASLVGAVVGVVTLVRSVL